MGRYIPPEALDRNLSLNQASGKGHSLGKRARPAGGLVVRFELPFAVWCTSCRPEAIIGQGVRFNAEKKKVGNYYSTPIWAFRFKHTVCGDTIEVRTDPKASEYVVTEGGRRRDYGVVKDEEWGVLKPAGATEEEKERLEKEGGFAKLEKIKGEKTEKETQQKRVKELWQDSGRRWGDPYEVSRMLRREFRVGRRQRQEDAKTGGVLAERYGLDVDLLAPSAEDTEIAKTTTFGKDLATPQPASKPLFNEKAHESPERTLKTKPAQRTSATTIARQKEKLHGVLKGNTRVNHNPFIHDSKTTARWEPRTKRRKADDTVAEAPGSDSAILQVDRQADEPAKISTGGALVAYDSDSD